MKKAGRKLFNCITVWCLVMAMTLYANASTIQDIQNDIANDKSNLDDITGEISDLEDEQDILLEEIADLDAELINIMTSIGLLDDEIAAKTADIETTQTMYDAAKEQEEAQYDAMVSLIQFLYEAGETEYLNIIFGDASFSEMLNRASYFEAISEYDQTLLEEYIDTKEQVGMLWNQLEEEKQDLELDKANMEDQKEYLDGLLAIKQQESDNFAAQISRARQEANALKVKIQQEEAELKKLQEEERRRQEEERRRQAAAASSGSYTVSSSVSDIINNASGSDLGKKIALYACQFIGNPYVYGGTSLTNGTDCSGFTYRVYKDFGYTLTRTSYQQQSVGREVSYSEAQPGDIICYSGHVGIYIGGGYIVHASSPETGIKVSKATYRPIITVRRII